MSGFGSVMLDDVALQGFRARPLMVLSPHFDDACFSLGALLARLGRGHLINIFTQGDHFAGRTAKDRQQVYLVRDAEDAAFATRCGLVRHDLGCEEPSLRGRRPSELVHVEDDIGQIILPIRAKLDKLAAAFAPGLRGVLLAPLGVGRHVNHRATAQLVLRALAAIQERYDVYLYEDLPYARNPLARLAALRRARRAAALGKRFVFRDGWTEKAPLLALYPSQLARRPTPSRFRPATLPLVTHEAFWSVTPHPTGHSA